MSKLGMSRTLQSKAFGWMVHHLHTNFAVHLNELKCWEEDFPAFGRAVAAKCGGLFDNIIAFVDGHFVPVCLQGGKLNVNWSV